MRMLTAAHGENAASKQRAEIHFVRERLVLSNLEQKLSGLNETSGNVNGIFSELGSILSAMPTKLQALGMTFQVVIIMGIGAAISSK